MTPCSDSVASSLPRSGNRRRSICFTRGGRNVCPLKAVISLYHAREFRALVGDATLRFQASKGGGSARLLLAVQFGRMGRNAKPVLREYAREFLPNSCWILDSQDEAAWR